jgi:hypothetical protein
MRLEHLLKLLDTSSGVFQRSLRFPDKTNLEDGAELNRCSL